MSMQPKYNYGTVVNCIDGTVQVQVLEFLKRRWEVEWVDLITAAAPERILAAGRDKEEIARIHRSIRESLEMQQAPRLSVVAHSDCDCNESPDSEKLAMVRRAVASLRREYPHAKVSGIWVDPDGRALEM